MTARLSNESMKSFLLKRVVKEYRKFIVGANNSFMKDSHLISNSFNLIFENNFVDIANEWNSFIGQFTNLSKSKGVFDDSDKNLELIKDNFIFDMLDNSYAAYFLKHIKSGEAFKGKTAKDINNYFLVVHEPDEENDKKYFVNDFSTKRLVASIKQEDIKKLPDAENDKSKQTNQIKGEKASTVHQYTMTTGSLYHNIDLNKLSKKEPERLNPSLGAIVVKKHGIGLPSKNADHLNIFFNAIPTLEMSRCAPYIDIAIVSRAEENLPKNIDNVTFMRFIKKEGKDSLVLDENIGIKSSKPFGFESIFGVDEYALEDNLDVSMMDIFTSPQVMANANVNNDIRYTKGIYGHEVLEPIAPLLTLSDLSIDISGMGIALFSSKVGSINLKLHDRSRLSDVSHLISPKNFGSTKMIIEFGWSHPEGNIANDNIIGQYLNCLRDRSVYTVKTSNFSFSSGNIVNIGLTLACYGDQHMTNVSSAVGRLVPAKIFKSSIRTMLETAARKKTSYETDKLKIKEVRNVMKVELRNATNNQNLIEFKTYRNIVNAFKIYRKNKNDKTKKQLIEKIDIIINPEKIPDQSDKAAAIKLKSERKDRINNLMFEKLYALGRKDSEGLKSDFLSDKFLTSYDNKVFNKNKKDSSQISLLNKFLPNPDEYVSLGKVLMSFIGHPLAMSGVFDEVQFVFYPLNMHSGGAAIHTTASMPIEYSLIKSVITEKLNSVTDINVKGFFNLIESKIIRDRSLSVYGISEVIRANNENIEAEKSNSDYLRAKKNIENAEKDKSLKLEAFVGTERETLIRGTENLNADIAADAQEIKDKEKTFSENIADKEKKLQETFEQETVNDQKTVDNTNKKISQLREDLKDDIGEKLEKIYRNISSDIRENKFVRPNLSIYMETLTQRDPMSSVNEAAYNLASSIDYIKTTLPNQLGINSILQDKQLEKTICRIHVYDENSSSNPRKRLIQSIMTEGSIDQVISGKKDIDIDKLLKDNGLNTSSKIKRYVKNSYPSITYGANNSTVHGISVTSNVSDQVSQVIQISSYARRNNQQNSSAQTNNFEETTVVPSSISLRTMGNPFISRGNEIYIDFGTNTTLDNIYVVKSVSHKISNGNFETNVNLIYSGQGDTRSIYNDIKRSLDNSKQT